MAQTISIPNFTDLNVLNQTGISEDALAGVTSLSVVNCSQFSDGSLVLIGNPGSNSSEFGTTGTLSSDTTLPLTSTTDLPHQAGNSVSLLFGTKINIYRATDVYGTGQQPPDSDFTLLSGMPIAIDPTLSYTRYTDPTGETTYWYKFTYFNSTTNAETAIADSTAMWGNGINYCSVDQIREAAGFSNNTNIPDSLIDEKRQKAQNTINGSLIPVYVFPLPQPTNPIIENLTIDLAAAYLLQQVYRTTSPAAVTQAKDDEDAATGRLDELVVKEVVLVNAQFIDETIPGGNGVSGYPDATARGHATHQNGGGGQIFYPGMRY